MSDGNTPPPTHEDYYNRIRSLAGSATSNLSSGEDEHLSRNVSLVLHNKYLQSTTSSSNSTNTSRNASNRRSPPRPDNLSLVVSQAEYRREWHMAVVEARTDGSIEVLIKGDPKSERDEVARGLLDVVDKMVWKACYKDGKVGKGGDGKRGSG